MRKSGSVTVFPLKVVTSVNNGNNCASMTEIKDGFDNIGLLPVSRKSCDR